MRRLMALGALVAFAMVACSQPEPAAITTAAGSSPRQDSCRLPISISDSTGHVQGAFIHFPTGQLETAAQSGGGASYDWPRHVWLPVPPNAVSPDGAQYAYLERKYPGTPGRTRLHVVDVASGSDQLYQLGSADDLSAYVIVVFGADGIWLSYSGYEAPGRGLFQPDLSTGALKDMSGGKELFDPVSREKGIFWATDAGPNPQASAIGFPIPARVVRFTPADASIDSWYSNPIGVKVFGADPAGHPIFGTSSQQVSGFDYWIATAPGEAKMIGLPAGFYQLFSDSRGVWFGGGSGIYLYSASTLKKVSVQAGSPAGTCA